MAKTTKRSGPLATRIGRVCHFTDPRNGEVVEGTYKRGRQVVRMVGMKRRENEPGNPLAGSMYDVDEQVFTVPRAIKITFGPAPKAVK